MLQSSTFNSNDMNMSIKQIAYYNQGMHEMRKIFGQQQPQPKQQFLQLVSHIPVQLISTF